VFEVDGRFADFASKTFTQFVQVEASSEFFFNAERAKAKSDEGVTTAGSGSVAQDIRSHPEIVLETPANVSDINFASYLIK